MAVSEERFFSNGLLASSCWEYEQILTPWCGPALQHWLKQWCGLGRD